jgi:hypothetical protein
MKTETIIPNKLKTELSRWTIQCLIMLLAIPCGFIVLLMMGFYILPIIGNVIGFFSIAILLLVYYLTSVYFHYKTDKNYTFKKPWWKSNRVYSTLFLIITVKVFAIFNKKIIALEIDLESIMIFTFFIFSIIYTWMLSEFMCKKLKSDKNRAFNYPIWASKRFILIIAIIFLLTITAYVFNLQDPVTDFYEDNFYDFIELLGVIFFYSYPFFILNFISELKNRSLNN